MSFDNRCLQSFSMCSFQGTNDNSRFSHLWIRTHSVLITDILRIFFLEKKHRRSQINLHRRFFFSTKAALKLSNGDNLSWIIRWVLKKLSVQCLYWIIIFRLMLQKLQSLCITPNYQFSPCQSNLVVSRLADSVATFLCEVNDRGGRLLVMPQIFMPWRCIWLMKKVNLKAWPHHYRKCCCIRFHWWLPTLWPCPSESRSLSRCNWSVLHRI